MPYQEGYRKGYVDAQLDEMGVGSINEANVPTKAPNQGLTNDQLNDYWLGYYHGRAHARTGEPPIGSIRREESEVQLTRFGCLRCGHHWIPRKPERPRICPKCKSPYWDKPRRKTREGE